MLICKKVQVSAHDNAVLAYPACGDGLFTTSGEYVKVLCFSHFTRYMTFSQTGKKGRKKQVKNSIEVSVVLHLVTGDTSDNP